MKQMEWKESQLRALKGVPWQIYQGTSWIYLDIYGYLGSEG